MSPSFAMVHVYSEEHLTSVSAGALFVQRQQIAFNGADKTAIKLPPSCCSSVAERDDGAVAGTFFNATLIACHS
jgi:hypothetical protein